MANFIGQSLGRYHILEQLGEGGMATVYKAFDARLERNVAVKVIRIEKLTLETISKSLKRFDREAKALAQLDHPNIIRISDFGEYEHRPYLVMEYIPGGTLKQRLGKPIPWREAVRFIIPIARALGYAHQQGIIHRDVKPSNILVGKAGIPILTDFGIAKIFDNEQTADLTGTMGVGTPEYMAPEQIASKSFDHRVDIYSLGIVLYEMITGQKPFQADTPLAVLLKHASEPLPSPRKFVPDLPVKVEQVILKSLTKLPDDRYSNMELFSIALEGLLTHEPQKDLPIPSGGVAGSQRSGNANQLGSPFKKILWGILIIVCLLLGSAAGYFALSRIHLPELPAASTTLPGAPSADEFPLTSIAGLPEPARDMATVTLTCTFTGTPVMKTASVNISSTYLYAGPSIYHLKVLCGQQVCSYPLGTQVNLLEQHGQSNEVWYFVSMPDGKTGWLFSEWLTIVINSSDIPTASFIPTYPGFPTSTSTPIGTQIPTQLLNGIKPPFSNCGCFCFIAPCNCANTCTPTP